MSLALLLCGLPALPAAAQEPLAAVDWLSDVVAPVAPPYTPESAAEAADAPVARSALPAEITMRPLDRPVPDRIGLLSPGDAGLPEDLWRASETTTLVRQIHEMEPPVLPAAWRLLGDLLMLKATPPQHSALGQEFYLARLDALLALGRFEAAREMMALAGYQHPDIFRRWFDLTILTGSETQACNRMRALPEITPTYPARIFCLARSGDWPAAAVTLETARALGVITPAETERLVRFLDDHAAPGLLPPPSDPSPLDFLLSEAMGEPFRTPSLPLPFAHADLRPITGWMARIEAAERLARHGAVDAGTLWSVYAERGPAASGLPWDRVKAAQLLDRALKDGTPEAVAQALPAAWDRMAEAKLLPALAARVGDRAADLALEGEAGAIAARLSALNGGTPDGLDPPLAALVSRTAPAAPASDPAMAAIGAGLAGDTPPAIADLIDQGRIGEALLHGAQLIEAGAAGNLDALTDGLSILSAAGQRETAYRAAIEIVVTGSAR